jgi:hypothetical protein
MSPANPERLCFVIGPIGDEGTETRLHADWVLQGIIQPIFKKHFNEYQVERADQIVAPGSINSQVINRLLDAPLVIADMSFHNANAFYELAIRHMVQLPTIHMIRVGDKIPFDVAPYRAIPFSYASPDALEQAKRDLKSAVEHVIAPNFVVDNPVTHARGVVELREHATPEQQLLLQQIESILARLDGVESSLATVRAVALAAAWTPSNVSWYIAQSRHITQPCRYSAQPRPNCTTNRSL